MKPIYSRVCLFIAILTALCIGVFNLIEMRSRIERLQTAFAEQVTLRQQAEADLARANNDLRSVSARLREAVGQLEVAVADKQSAQQEAAEQSRRAAKLETALGETSQRLKETQDQLARYVYSGRTPEDVMTLGDRLKTLQAQLGEQQQANQKLEAQIAEWKKLYPDITNVVVLPADLRGQVLAFDPKWRFIVINAGQEQGVRPRGKLLVSRDGKLVGRAIVTRVDKDRAIANLLSESPEVLEGDSVLPADPRS